VKLAFYEQRREILIVPSRESVFSLKTITSREKKKRVGVEKSGRTESTNPRSIQEKRESSLGRRRFREERENSEQNDPLKGGERGKREKGKKIRTLCFWGAKRV